MMGKRAAVPAMLESDKKWRAESDLRTLMDAHEIQKDSARLKAAKAAAKKQLAALKAASE